jgi:ppGpp synthetase/RelA/SpoT-type nucleotidyltranferase
MKIDDFKKLDSNSITKWYKENEKILIKINSLINVELNAFCEQTAKNRVVFFATRIKKLPSLIDKIELFNEEKERSLAKQVKDRKLDPEKFEIQDIINDMVGARIVFYFEPDLPSSLIYFLTYPVFNVIDVKVYGFLSVKAKHPFDISSRLVEIAKLYNPKLDKSNKPSGYESLHVLIKYNENHLKQKIKMLKKLKINESDIKKMCDFPIEIQIRSLMQHGWAQIEHTYNYSEKKKVVKDKHKINIRKDDFIVNKFLSIGVEQHQNQIWAQHWNRNEDEGKLSREATTYGDRFIFFNKQEKEQLEEYQESIVSSIRHLHLDQLKKLKSLIRKFESKYHLLGDEIPVEREKWGQRRAFVLLLGYIGLFNEKKQNDKHINDLLSLFSLKMSNDLKINLIALYEYVRKVDILNREDKEHDKKIIYFYDALVSYRAAGVHYITGNSRRALNLMEDALAERVEKLKEGKEDPVSRSTLINKMHIMRRIAEYYYRAYNQDNKTDKNDLLSACKYIIDAYNETDTPVEDRLIIEKRKILSKIIIFNLFAYVLEVGTIDVSGFLDIINKFETDIIELLKPDALYCKENGSLGLEALAIYSWAKGDIDSARKYINEAIDRVLSKSYLKHVINEMYEVRYIVEKPIKKAN